MGSITSVNNLTKKIDVKDEALLAIFTGSDSYSDTLSAESEDFGNNWESSDNIAVTWNNDGKINRAVSGTFSRKGKNITITGLVSASKFSVDVFGYLEIGPKAVEGEEQKKAASLKVRIGNMPSQKNVKGDWIIDFSDKGHSEDDEDVVSGSEINLSALIDWIKDKSGDVEAKLELPENAGKDKPEDMIIEFNKFYYNITQNTYDFDVKSKTGSEISFGAFTIKEAGFRITNVPTALMLTEDVEADIEEGRPQLLSSGRPRKTLPINQASSIN